ncbi:hypothetical protein BN79_040 [Yersinia phage phiR2-01]|uniref:Uncharacterized protein n=1 Tax=Yersinia phage phiR2-01 TaxID=1206557 RepID=I7J3T2_9CAUD|nr:hypothetical protein BN79_040 [Yersinia phage phiR2-01]CCI88468.1 hypothetical protein BN79_040 [Yersinia phage phiR2-01]
MRIISKFNDVYDLQNSLFDPDHVWERKTEKLLVKVTDDAEKNIVHSRQVYREGASSIRGDFTYRVVPLFLAGEVYWLHSIEDSLYNLNIKTFDIDFIFDKMEELGLHVRGYFDDKSRGNVRETIRDTLIEAKPKAQRILSELRVPIALVKGIKKNENDEVRNFVIETNIRFHLSGIPWNELESNLYRLHQVLEQYIFGTLGTGEPDTITVSDKDRLMAYGFDTKTSFRNMGR